MFGCGWVGVAWGGLGLLYGLWVGVDSPVVFGFLWVWCGIGLRFGCFLVTCGLGAFWGGFGWAVCGVWLLALGGLGVLPEGFGFLWGWYNIRVCSLSAFGCLWVCVFSLSFCLGFSGSFVCCFWGVLGLVWCFGLCLYWLVLRFTVGLVA